MKTRILVLASIVPATAFMAGCGDKKNESAYVPQPLPKVAPFSLPEGQEKTLFPMEVGNTWTYEMVAAGQDDAGRPFRIGDELVFKVVKVEDKPDGRYGTLEIARIDPQTKQSTLSDVQVWMVNEKGIYQVQIGAKTPLKFEPMQPVITFPAKPGTEFTWEGKGPVSQAYGASKLKSRIEEPMTVDAANERFNAISVTQNQDWTIDSRTGTMRTTSWWVPNVGLVRLFQQAVGVGGAQLNFKLKSKNLK